MKVTQKCESAFEEFSCFYALRQHKTCEYGIQMKSAEFDENNVLEDDDADLKEKFQACQHFLVNSQPEKPQTTLFHSRNYLKWRECGDAKSCGRMR